MPRVFNIVTYINSRCLLLVDACQGIQAQTVANFYLAFGSGLEIVPVINKIDLQTANTSAVAQQIKSAFEIAEEPVKISAKTGLNIDTLLERIIEKIPAPTFSKSKAFRALLFDSWYDKYVGVVCLIAVKDGVVKTGFLISI